MRATEFEFRHQSLLRQLLIAAAVATYSFDRDDVVWRFIKMSPSSTELERICFLAATLLIGAGALLCTRASAFAPSGEMGERNARLAPGQYAGELLYAVGLAYLAPLSGFIFLIAGESLRILRLMGRDRARTASEPSQPSETEPRPPHARWPTAFRLHAAKWGIFITMLFFIVTLTDRVAEYMAGAAFLVSVLLNTGSRKKKPEIAPGSSGQH